MEIVNWAEKYNIYDPKTGKTYSNMVGTNVQKGAVFTLKGEKESVVKAGDGVKLLPAEILGTHTIKMKLPVSGKKARKWPICPEQ